MKARFFATATACLCALLLAACDGIGTSIHAENPYGGLGGWTGDEGADSSTGSSLGFDAGSLLGFSNAGDVEAIVRLFTTAVTSPDAGGTIDVVFSAADLGLPAGGTVTLSLRGNGIDYENTKGADADGTVRFTVPLIASGTEITVSLTLWEADGTLACTGTKTQRVTGLSSDIAVSLSGGGSAPAPAPAPTPAPVPADFVFVAGGPFTFLDATLAASGSQTIEDFYICSHEVTQAEYATYCVYSVSLSASEGLGPNYPAYWVNWYDALVYCNRRSMAEGLTPCYAIGGSTDPADWPGVYSSGGKYRGPRSSTAAWNNAACDFTANGYRLPTEAEWEYAARGGPADDPYIYSGSNTIGDVAWYRSNGGGKTHPVMRRTPNSLGLYDMSGNVAEWCWDKVSTSSRVRRGGSWSSNDSLCDVSYRYNLYPYNAYNYQGFRVCRTAP